MKALAALDRMSRGVDWCDQDEQARRWSAAHRVLEGGIYTDAAICEEAAAQADYEQRIRSALVDVPAVEPEQRKFKLGDRVRKHSGAWWEGRVVGFYTTHQTPVGYNVQLDTVENGPVQIYPESALELSGPNSPPLSREGEDSAEVKVLSVARAIAKVEGFALPNDMSLPFSDGSRIGQVMAKARAALAATRRGSATTQKGCAE